MNTKGQEANRICGQHCTNMESAGSLFLSYTFIAYLVDCTKLQRTTRWAGAKKDGKGGGWKLLGSGVRGGDRQDLIKDGLCYVISSKRRRPRCCRDGEQLAWGCLIACSDSFQASSSGARARYGTDVYCWVSRRRLHGNHWLLPLLCSSDTFPSWDRHIAMIFEWAQLLQQGKAGIYSAGIDRTAHSLLSHCVLIWDSTLESLNLCLSFWF